MRVFTRVRNALGLFVLALIPPATFAQETGHSITPNFKDADLTKVTMLAATPMDFGALYEAFLAILQVHGMRL